MVDWAFNWRLNEHIQLTGSIGSEFDTHYELTLLDGERVRFSSDPALRLGVGMVWVF